MFGFAALIGATLLAAASYTLLREEVVTAASVSINTFASDCTTPKTEWSLGQTVCAVVTGAPNEQRIVWVAPDGKIADVSGSFTGTGSDTYTLLTTGSLAQNGTWRVVSIDNSGGGFAIAAFLVRPENTPSADLSVLKFGPPQAVAGSTITYTIEVTNRGPDAAQNVVLSEPVPNDSTFASEAQTSGPSATCTNPSVGGTGTSTCTIPSLDPGASAIFTFIYNVNSGTPADTLIFNTATVSSSTTELFQGNNAGSYITSVVDAPPTPSCTISCPANITTTNNGQNLCSVVVTYATPSTSGNCADPDSGQTPDVICNPPSGSAFPIGTTLVVCAAGGTTCIFTVTVQDTRPPAPLTINCPANVTVNEDSEGAGYALVNYTAPATTGNCVTVACEPPAGSPFFVGTTTVACTATDSANDTATCSFTVTVNGGGGGNCTLTCPSDVTQTAAAGQCSANVTFSSPTTGGSCGAVTCRDQNNNVRQSGDSFPVGTTVITCTTPEGANCSFNITVAAAAPTITTCAANRTITANANCEAVIPNLIGEVVATGCSTVVTQSPTAGSIVGPGIVTVTITAENSAGEATCTATVTILSPTAPTISCPANITVSNDQNQCGAVVTYANATAGSTCSDVTVSCSPPSGATFPIGATDVLCTATDASGTSSTCTFKVTVNDTQLPTISCPANITRANDQDQCGAVVTYASPTAADNCPGVNATCSPASGTQFPIGTTTVTCTATDASGNTATCSFTVTVNDTQSPTATCPSNITVGTDPNSAFATVNYQSTVSDNCPGATISCAPPAGSQFAVGTTTVTCTATDAAQNQASCSFTVTVSDNQPPTIVCPGNINKSNDLNQCGSVTTYPNPQVTDNQPGATFVCSPPSGATFPVGVTTVTCTATDVGGNQSSCSFTVTVRDTQLPVISCPANLTVPNAAGQCSANVNPGVATATDNCPGVTVVGVRSDGLALNAAYPVGTTTIIWTARDAAVPANQVSCTQTIVVNDTQSPTITGASANPSVLWPPNHKMRDVTISYNVTDNCTATSQIISTLSVSSNEGTPDDWQIIDAHHVKLRAEREGGGSGRIYTITITSRDGANNISTQTVTVTVPHNQ